MSATVAGVPQVSRGGRICRRVFVFAKQARDFVPPTAGLKDIVPIARARANFELIDAAELAKRWNLPESWVRSHSRERIAKECRIPHVKLGRYVRFEWGAPHLEEWLARQRQ